MRDYVGAGRPVVQARDLITRIRLVAKGGVPASEKPAALLPQPIARAPVAPPPMAAVTDHLPEGTSAFVIEPAADIPDEPAAEPEEHAAGHLRPQPGRRRATPRRTAARLRAWTRTCSTIC